MAYAAQFSFFAGPGNTTVGQCSAVLQTHGAIGTSSLPAVTATLANDATHFYFKSLGSGWFSFYYDAFAAGYVGNIEFLYGGALKAVVSVQPPEIETVLSQAVSTAPTAGTVEHALQCARAEAIGKRVVDKTTDTETLSDSDGTTTVKAFALTPTGGGPYSTRT